VAADPLTALRRLRAAADDGRLEELARRHAVRVLTAFGSAARAEPTTTGPTSCPSPRG